MSTSPYKLIKSLELSLLGTISKIDIYSEPADVRKVVTALKYELVDARLDIRDYELSETREEQLANAKSAKERLDNVRGHILVASEHNIFSAIDVAHISANIEQVIENIR